MSDSESEFFSVNQLSHRRSSFAKQCHSGRSGVLSQKRSSPSNRFIDPEQCHGLNEHRTGVESDPRSENKSSERHETAHSQVLPNYVPHTHAPPPDTPLQSFARLGNALSQSVLGRKFWVEAPKMAKGFLSSERQVVMFGAPLNTGVKYCGHKQLIASLRSCGLERVILSNGWALEDMGDLPLDQVFKAAQQSDAAKLNQEPKIIDAYAVGKALERVYDAAHEASRRGAFVLTVGGDRSISSATISGVLKSRRNLSVVYVSAFADCNTPETTITREYHGMTAAHILGWMRREIKGFEWMKHFIPENRVAFISLRDVDVEEAIKMRESGVRIFSMYEIDRYGIGAVMDMAIHSINPHNDRPIHLSLDLSACDPTVVPGAQQEGGLTLRETFYLCETLARTNALGSMDIVQVCRAGVDLDPQRAASVALNLISSAIGRRIL
eukprot:PhM_4_TR7044/c0_g2_i1/m.97581/K01476/E3.5.3.1, rocF, arg; arginase